ncbi:MAG TPA: expansin EXLX1 family cellulose-binding protein [Polyangia bacterium]|jgi:expansin (peptidoglycan-binding protein)|nr:expansin EXLX1 family cellulose-binding protein [Polyangia bacterium]
MSLTYCFRLNRLLPLTLAFVCGAACGAPAGGGVTLGQPQQGIATYYDATGAGNCGYDPSPNDLLVAAIDAPQYAGSASCGECVDVVGPSGAVRVRIVDKCPECGVGHLDLSREAFARIAELQLGRVDITWTVVSCNVTGSIQYHFKDGSSQYYTAIQIRNHRIPVQKLEWRRDGNWQEIQRADYNYFVVSNGVGPGAFRLRVTAVDGQQLEDDIASVLDNATVSGSGQFQVR